jgi:hypothetical protein
MSGDNGQLRAQSWENLPTHYSSIGGKKEEPLDSSPKATYKGKIPDGEKLF